MIILATYQGKSQEESQKTLNTTYDLEMGIGASLLATAIASSILVLIIPSEAELQDQNEELKEWGIVKIFSERKLTKIRQIDMPREHLDYIAFGLSHFVKENSTTIVFKRIKKGLRVRILVPHPNSRTVMEQQILENNSGISQEINNLLMWVSRIQGMINESGENKEKWGNIEVKLYDNPPIDFYCRADGEIYVGPYLPGMLSGDAITYQFDYYSKGGTYYSELFDKLWNGEEAALNIVEQSRKYFKGNQKNAIEKVLRYFCDCMGNGCNQKVIGVMVVFKRSMRRTFFSCNKPHTERHVSHKKKDGAVGEMLNLNGTNGDEKTDFWRDYMNDLSFVRKQLNRLTRVTRIDKSISKFKEDDTVAIMAVPLIVNKDLIGAITFDFAELPQKYMDEIEEMNKIEMNGEVPQCMQIRTWFSLADSCADIISEMLGYDIEIEYQKLYDERWSENE